MRSMLFVYLLICLWQVIISAVDFTVQPNDKILFIGHSSTLQGEVEAHGFVRVFEAEVRKLIANVTVSVGSSVRGTNQIILDRVRDGEWMDSYSPDKVMLTFGMEMFDKYYESRLLQQMSHKSAFSAMRFEVESIIAQLVSRSMHSIIIAPLLIDGERTGSIDDHRKLSVELIEESTGMFRQIARDYNVMYIDIPTLLSKCLEKINSNDLSQSVLTLNGRIFNEAGHEFIATSLADSLGLKLFASGADDERSNRSNGWCGRSSGNLIRAKEEEVRLRKEELLFLQKEKKVLQQEAAQISALHM